jgi:hypothetical protein
MYSEGVFCIRIFLLFTPLKCNYAISLTDIWYSRNFPSRKEDSLWTVAGYITTPRDYAPTVFIWYNFKSTQILWCLSNSAFQIMQCYRRKVWEIVIKILHTITTKNYIDQYWPQCDVTLFPTNMLQLRWLVGNSRRGYNFNWSLICRNKQTKL